MNELSEDLDGTHVAFLRRFIRKNECRKDGDHWTVFQNLFLDSSQRDLSFHLRESSWLKNDIDTYRRSYNQSGQTIPGVVQVSGGVFGHASLPMPLREDDPNDFPLYRALHCSWPCPTENDANSLANKVTTLIATDKRFASVEFDLEKK